MKCSASSFLILVTLALSACDSGYLAVSQQMAPNNTTDTTVDYINPELVKAGETVTITGDNLSETLQLRLGDAVLTGKKSNARELTFTVPADAKIGEIKLEVADESTTLATTSLWVTAPTADHYSDIPASEVCKGVTFTGLDGKTLEGEKTCADNSKTTLQTCDASLRENCIASDDFPAIDKQALSVAAPYLSSLVIAGVRGRLQNCEANGADCYLPAFSLLTQPLTAIDINAFVPEIIKQGTTLAGVAGSVAPQPLDCAVDADTECTTVTAFPAYDVAYLHAHQAEVASDMTVAGVTGTLASCSDNSSDCLLGAYDSTTQPRQAVDYDSLDVTLIKAGVQIADKTGTLAVSQADCNADNQINCLATAAYPAINKASATANQAKFASSITAGGVTGTLASCTNDGGTACTAVTAFPALDKAHLNSHKSEVGSSLSIAGVTGTMGDCAANGSNCYLSPYSTGVQTLKAISYDSIAANIIKSTKTIAGITGTVAQAPANCGSDGQTDCVTVAAYPATEIAAINAGQAKILDTLTVAGITGTLHNCAADAATDCYAVPNYPALDKASVTTNKAHIHTSMTAGGVTGTLASCSSDAQTNCLAIPTYPAANLSNISSNTAKIHSSITLAGVAGTMSSCTANGSGCYLAPFASGTQPLKAIDYDALNANFIKTGVTIGGVAGNALEAPADCSADAGTNCVAVTNFPAMDRVTINAAKAKILSSLTIGGVVGTAPNCALDGDTGCYTIATLPALDKANFNANKTKALAAVTTNSVTGTLGTCAANNSDCYLATYAASTQPLKAINFYTLSAGDIKTGSAIGTVNGTMVPSPSNCATDGATNCVAVAAYPALNYTNTNAAKTKILSTITLGGVAGTMASCTAGGQTSCMTSSSYPSLDKSNASTNVGKIRSGVTVMTGVAGSLADCTANGSGCFLPSYVASTQPLKAINYDILDPATIKTGSTIGGVTGTLVPLPANCSADAQTDCVTIANYPAVNASNVTTNLAKISSSLTIGGQAGTFANCNADNGTNCLAVTNFPAVLASNMTSNKAKVHSSLTIAGQAGTTNDCTALGSNCYVPAYVTTTQPLKAISFDSLSTGIIKNGTTIAGLTGQYPSSTYPLTTGDAYSDMTAASFNTQITSSSTVGWFNRNGARQSHAGDTDITAANIRSTATIFGTTGNFVVPGAWDVRRATTVGGSVTPKLAVSCRNRSATWLNYSNSHLVSVDHTTNLATKALHGFTNGETIHINFSNIDSAGMSDVDNLYVRDVTTNSFRFATSSGGAAVAFTGDPADLSVHRWNSSTMTSRTTTTDPRNGPSSAAWGSDYVCEGVDTGSTSNIWLDVTTGGCASGRDCRYKDQVTNLEWSKKITATYYGDALKTCDDLVYDGLSNWRLPTFHELLEAYDHTIYSARNDNWIVDGDMIPGQDMWSSTKRTDWDDDILAVNLSLGWATGHSMYENRNVVCVRKTGENL